MSPSIRLQLPHSFLVNSRNTNLFSFVARSAASAALVAQRTLPGPRALSEDIGAPASGDAGGAGAGVAAFWGSARAAKRTTGMRETKIDLPMQCCGENRPAGP